VAKKRYAGLLWTKSDKYDKKDVKGMESVRRDKCVSETTETLCFFISNLPSSCLLVRNTIDQMISTILTEKNIALMVERLVEKVESVARGTVDLSELVISKSLSKPPKDYYPCPPQAMVALKMAEENPDTAPKMGDRVPYVILIRSRASLTPPPQLHHHRVRR
jgi:DNA polymerase delta subunit 1